MSIAVLPFNAGPKTRAALARQIPNFAAEIVRGRTQAEVNSVNYLIRINEDEPPRYANANPSEELNDSSIIEQLLSQTQAEVAIDGLLVEKDGQYEMTYRTWSRGVSDPIQVETVQFGTDQFFPTLRALVEELAARSEKVLPADTSKDEELFGTSNAQALISFLEGYDVLQYIERSQGQVIPEFSPESAFNSLLEAAKLDPDWEAPMAVLMQLVRSTVNYRVGNAEMVEAALTTAMQLEPNNAVPHILLSELKQATGDLNAANEALEKAQTLDPNEPAIYTRIGINQMNMGLPANAEQNFKRALELEGPDKPSMGFLAHLLSQNNRMHEVPDLWRSIIDSNPQNAHAWANLGGSLMGAGNSAESLRTFDKALETLEGDEQKMIVKRSYAPALAHMGEFDKAMDFYEDCLDVAPADIDLNLEYARTLQQAGRTFEVPKVLRDVLGANPHPNIRAETLAWLVELEQPKRVEAVAQAKEKMDQEDFAAATKILRPMRNWLADYWKMWALYASALNRLEDHREAEDAAMRLIQLFPGNEIGFIELGNSLMAQKRFEEAYNAMRHGMGTIQGSLGIALQYGLAAKRFGQSDEAKAIAQQIRQGLGNDVKDIEAALDEMEA